MPAFPCKLGASNKWRVCHKNSEGKNEAVKKDGKPVDGGGHWKKKEAMKQCHAINMNE